MKNLRSMSRIELLTLFREREFESARIYQENEDLRLRLDNISESVEHEFESRATEIFQEVADKCAKREAESAQYIEKLWIELRARLTQYCRAQTGLEHIIERIDSIPR